MTKALTLRLEDGMYEALRKEAFDARLPISEIVRTAVNVHLNELFKMRHPASVCDARDCLAGAIGITTPGGFHFCTEHMPKRPYGPRSRKDRTMTTEYPVGRCSESGCHYPEPHRHGFDCTPTCTCEGIGAITQPLEEGEPTTCDWGFCNRKSVAMRVDKGTVDAIANEGEEVWLAVCSWHAGWDDLEVSGGE